MNVATNSGGILVTITNAPRNEVTRPVLKPCGVFVATALFLIGVLVSPASGQIPGAELQEAGCWSHADRDNPISRSSGFYSPTDLAGGPECGGPIVGESSVYLFSGEFFHTAVDLRIPGRGIDFVWSRKYRSRIGPSTRAGNGWDHSYNIFLTEVPAGPGEVQALHLHTTTDLNWSPPIDPGGAPEDLRYCTLRATGPEGFADPVTATFVETDDADLVAADPDIPDPGEAFFYLVTAKNGVREGSRGTTSSGTPRDGLTCGLSGPDLLLADGNTRRDLHRLQANGTWVADEFFRVLSEDGNGSNTLTFPDGKTWTFLPFDGGTAEGKITSIVDRNGNQLSFLYDTQGRLDTVVDTLGRNITVAYDSAGFIESVTDFALRQVSYTYYQNGDAGGSFGDLATVTSPPVSGTPTGNDFLTGKTTSYTYSKGLAQPVLNHNLLTITDPKGQTWLSNTYSAETDSGATNFDRLLSQIWGDPDDRLDYVYVPVVPSVANNFAAIKTIVNDRVGNVAEYFFDGNNRNVRTLEYTGRASDPDQPTTAVLNRPSGALRPGNPPLGDPAFFETLWAYNDDSLTTQVTYPNSNTTSYTYDELHSDRRSQGNLLQRCRNPGPLGGDQTVLCESYLYTDSACACSGAGTNFVRGHTDYRGHPTVHTYDAGGNRVHTEHRISSIVEDYEYNAFGQMTAHIRPDNGSSHRRRDEYSFHTLVPQLGYLESTIVDAPTLALTESFEYDSVGNLVRSTDPLGNDTTFVVNQLNQKIRETSREVGPGGPRYEKDFYYDANDNVVRIDVQNVDDQGVVQFNSHFTTIYEYEILNQGIRTCRESGSYTGAIPGIVGLPVCSGLPDSEFIVTEYEYDSNRNRTLTRFGEATNGNQPTNTIHQLFDERDLLFRTVRAQGDSGQSTRQLDYDGNRNLRREIAGLEDLPDQRLTTRMYDGYDRLVSRTDAMGNTSSYGYDANSNVVSVNVQGETDDATPGSVGNVRLYEAAYVFDEMDRLTDVVVEFFDTASQQALGDGQATTLIDYNDNSQIVEITNDNGHATTAVYDTANRIAMLTDAKANEVSYGYDANSNLLTMLETDRSDLVGEQDQVFATTYGYDGLDRLTSTLDNVGNLMTYAYDSRSNRIREEDALRASAVDPGNVVTYGFDGTNRLVSTVRQLTDDGTGAGTVTGSITTEQMWDDSSRRIGRTDDNGNQTTFEYDALNRVIVRQFADGTQDTYGYDVHDNRTSAADANGSTADSSYDLLDRLLQTDITPGPGVSSDVIEETYRYDGLSRLVQAADEDSTIVRAYDSLSNVRQDTQNGVTVVSAHDGVGNRKSCNYPGGRAFTMLHDQLERLASIGESGGGSIATYAYVGRDRIRQRQHGNGTQLDWVYDGVRLPTRTTHSAGIDDRAYQWDGMYNKTRREVVPPSPLQLTFNYGYDSAYRLVQTTVNNAATTVRMTAYDLDGLGNRQSVTGLGTPDPGFYTLDATTPEPADAQVNQYTDTSFDTRTYDTNGNLIAMDSGLPTQRTMQYDYRNRMVSFVAIGGATTTFNYDALDRRIEKITPSGTVRYIYDGDQVIEEQDTGGMTLASYVYGFDGVPKGASLRAPELLHMQRTGTDYYYHADDAGNVMAVSDDLGAVVDRYDYEDFGRPVSGPPASSGNPYRFAGMRYETYDPQTSWYENRSRYLDPRAGRFTTREPQGMWATRLHLGNGYSFSASSPWTNGDQGVTTRQHCSEMATTEDAGTGDDGESDDSSLLDSLRDDDYFILNYANYQSADRIHPLVALNNPAPGNDGEEADAAKKDTQEDRPEPDSDNERSK